MSFYVKLCDHITDCTKHNDLFGSIVITQLCQIGLLNFTQITLITQMSYVAA